MPAVQPCALLLVVGPEWRVETVSANAAKLGTIAPDKAVGEPLSDLIGSDEVHTLRNRVSWLASDESEVYEFGVRWGVLTLDVRAVRDGQRYLIEAEEAAEPRLTDGIGMVRSMTDRLSGDDPGKSAEQGMRRLQALIGFDRAWLCDRRGHDISRREQSAADDSFSEGLLEAPQYTRPAEFRGWRIPEVLLSGNHAEIAAWRKAEALRRTRENRPDLLR